MHSVMLLRLLPCSPRCQRGRCVAWTQDDLPTTLLAPSTITLTDRHGNSATLANGERPAKRARNEGTPTLCAANDRPRSKWRLQVAVVMAQGGCRSPAAAAEHVAATLQLPQEGPPMWTLPATSLADLGISDAGTCAVLARVAAPDAGSLQVGIGVYAGGVSACGNESKPVHEVLLLDGAALLDSAVLLIARFTGALQASFRLDVTARRSENVCSHTLVHDPPQEAAVQLAAYQVAIRDRKALRELITSHAHSVEDIRQVWCQREAGVHAVRAQAAQREEELSALVAAVAATDVAGIDADLLRIDTMFREGQPLQLVHVSRPAGGHTEGRPLTAGGRSRRVWHAGGGRQARGATGMRPA
jgi:hypothetical protein